LTTNCNICRNLNFAVEVKTNKYHREANALFNAINMHAQRIHGKKLKRRKERKRMRVVLMKR
jgi:hypothetical protein